MAPVSEKYTEPLLSREDYFSQWKKEELANLKEIHKVEIYNEYKTKHIVFNRDGHACQVEGCTYTNSPITLHHFKHKANGGKTTPRNCITVCKAHQAQYHSGKTALKFKEVEHLPNHIRGITQAHEKYVNGHKEEKPIDWKLKKHEMRLLRKENRKVWGLPLSMDQLFYLMKFISTFYEGITA